MIRWLNYFALSALSIILAVTLVPASVWYTVNAIQVGESKSGEPAPITADREIRREFQGSYQVIIRGIDSQDAVCDARSGVFTYEARSTLLKRDMAWWAPGDLRCSNLPAGEYIMETTWTIHNILWGLAPNKHVKAYSNPFSVTPTD